MVFHGDCIYAYDHLGHTASDEVGKEVIKKIDLKTGEEEHFLYNIILQVVAIRIMAIMKMKAK